MLNAEKYKDRIKELDYRFALCNGKLKPCRDVSCDNCEFNKVGGKACMKYVNKWLLEEYTDPILNEDEKKILRGVIETIKPFTDVKPLILRGKRNIVLCYGDEDVYLPTFKDTMDTMFENLELDKPYDLEELGLC